MGLITNAWWNIDITHYKANLLSDEGRLYKNLTEGRVPVRPSLVWEDTIQINFQLIPLELQKLVSCFQYIFYDFKEDPET